MKYYILGAVLLGVALLTGPAHASIITINFDDLTPGCNPPGTSGCAAPAGTNIVVVSNQYLVSDGVSFSATGPGGFDYEVLVESGTEYNTSKPNVIATGFVSGGPPPTSQTLEGGSSVSLILTFTNPVYNLNFNAVGNDSTAPSTQFAQANVFQNNSLTPTTVSLMTNSSGNSGGLNPDPQNLSAYPGITKLVIFNDTNTDGTAYDDFVFNNSGPAPEPSTLLLTGLCGILWAGRRFAARKSR
jgi:hypothetical protein